MALGLSLPSMLRSKSLEQEKLIGEYCITDVSIDFDQGVREGLVWVWFRRRHGDGVRPHEEWHSVIFL